MVLSTSSTPGSWSSRSPGQGFPHIYKRALGSRETGKLPGRQIWHLCQLKVWGGFRIAPTPLQRLVCDSQQGCLLIVQLKRHLLFKVFSTHSVRRGWLLPTSASVSTISFVSFTALVSSCHFSPPALILPFHKTPGSGSCSWFHPLPPADCCCAALEDNLSAKWISK